METANRRSATHKLSSIPEYTRGVVNRMPLKMFDGGMFEQKQSEMLARNPGVAANRTASPSPGALALPSPEPTSAPNTSPVQANTATTSPATPPQFGPGRIDDTQNAARTERMAMYDRASAATNAITAMNTPATAPAKKYAPADFNLPGNTFTPMAVPQLRDGGEVSPWSMRGIVKNVSGMFEKTPEQIQRAKDLADYKARAEAARAAPAPAATAQTVGISGYVGNSAMQRREAAAGLRDGGDLRTGKGGVVPGTGKGDKIPAKYEPGEFVVSNAMLDADPSLLPHLRQLRKQVLAGKGMTPEQADAKALMGTVVKAEDGLLLGYDKSVTARAVEAQKVAEIEAQRIAAVKDRIAAIEAEKAHGERVNPSQKPPSAVNNYNLPQNPPIDSKVSAATSAAKTAAQPGSATEALAKVRTLPMDSSKVMEATGVAGKAGNLLAKAAPPLVFAKGVYDAGSGIYEGDAVKAGTGVADTAAAGMLMTGVGTVPAATYLAARGVYETPEMIRAGLGEKNLEKVGGIINHIGLKTGLWGANDDALLAGKAATASNAQVVEPNSPNSAQTATNNLSNAIAVTEGSNRQSAQNKARATAPSTPTSAATLLGQTGKDVGYGVTRFDVPGKSPLFTNMTDAQGMASNEALVNRGAPTAQNQLAMYGIQARQDAADQARAVKYQYDQEVADAQARNAAAQRLYGYGPNGKHPSRAERDMMRLENERQNYANQANTQVETQKLARDKFAMEAFSAGLDNKVKQQIFDAQQEYLAAGDDPVKLKTAQRKLASFGVKFDSDKPLVMQPVYETDPMTGKKSQVSPAMIVHSDGRIQEVGGGSAATTPSKPSQADIAFLKANPKQAAKFDATFGNGSAAKVLN